MTKKFRLATVFLGVLLVLGLSLAACAAPTTTPPPTPPTTPPVTTPPPTPPAPPPPTPPPTPPTPPTPPAAGCTPTAAPAVSFEAATYTDPTYGFTVQYPKEWVERPDMLTTPYHVKAFSVEAFVPGIAIMAFPADAPESVDWIKKSVDLVKGTSPKLTSNIKDAFTPDCSKAYEFKIGYISATGYEAEGWCKDVDRGDKRIRFMVYTVSAFAPYDEALFKEVANSVIFK